MSPLPTTGAAAHKVGDPQGIHSREAEYRRRAHSLLRGEYRSYFRGAGLGEADREPLVCEVVDDVLLAEASGRLRAEGRAARFAYLKVALWRRLRMEWRHRQRHPVEVSDPHGAVLERIAADTDTAKAALNRCALGLVAAALEDALDDREREIARLFLLEERSEREVASELGMGRSAACTRLEQVREKLRAHLAENGIILAMEERLPVRVYGDEWERLRREPVRLRLRRDVFRSWLVRYRELGQVERIVPWVFVVLYVAEIVRQLVA